jgi:hypothetical protein
VDDPSYTSLQQPYDRFKRQCEHIIEQLVQEANQNRNTSSSTTTKGTTPIQYTNIRCGAIFSDDPYCIQCTALSLQMWTGPYLSTPIDCNSSYNVSQLMRLMLRQASFASTIHDDNTTRQPPPPPPLRPIYYYTRCVSQYPYPVPYGEYLVSYRKAYGISWFVPIVLPNVLVEYGVVRLLHWFLYGTNTRMMRMIETMIPFRSPNFSLRQLPYLESIDYLLQVTLQDHTFDMTETIRDFPQLLQIEETMEECFVRRRQHRRRCINHYHNKNKNM